MHSTKNEILALLKRSDGASVEELSTALGFASMTVRQHLTALERDLGEYFAGKPGEYDVPLHAPGTAFQHGFVPHVPPAGACARRIGCGATESW